MTESKSGDIPTVTAQFMCDVPASPARVLALAEMVEASLTALLGRPPSDHEFTLVVSNRSLKAHLRAFTEEAESAGRAIEQVTRDPMMTRRFPPRQRIQVAHALRTGFEKLRDAGLTVGGASGQETTRIDSTLISVLKGLEADAPPPTVVRGSSEEVCAIAGISRRQDGRLLARLKVEGRWSDFVLNPEVADVAFDLLRSGGSARIELDATWEGSDGEAFRIVASQSTIVGIHAQAPFLPSDELLNALRDAVSADSANTSALRIYSELELEAPQGAQGLS